MKLPIDYNYYNVILWKRNSVVRHYAMFYLSLDFLNEDFDYVMFLKFDIRYSLKVLDYKDTIIALESIFSEDESIFVIITNRIDPPPYSVRADEFIYSFGCNFDSFRKLVCDLRLHNLFADNFLFELLDFIFEGHSDFKKVIVRQFPIKSTMTRSHDLLDVVIPHRGQIDYLNSVLFFLTPLKNLKVRVGIDQRMTDDTLALGKLNPNVSFYNFNPNPAGPYVIRNELIDKGTNSTIFFQDSDDIPCADRFDLLTNFMSCTGSQLCGSHELRLDYYNRSVRAFRYPTDVNEALKKEPGHPLLHPTSAITREAFYLCQKLSEDRTFGNDTKFLLYSYFILQSIKNIDEFLYIRRRHPDSLTTSPGTMIGSPLREELLYKWKYDFEQIKAGILKLEDSSLVYEKSALSAKSYKI